MQQMELDFAVAKPLYTLPVAWSNPIPASAKISSRVSNSDRFFELKESTPEEIIARAWDKEKDIQKLIAILRKDFPEVEMPLTHYFVGDLYAREIFMPAGALVVGQIHKHDTISFVSQGEAIIFSSAAGVSRVTAPKTFMSAAGTRRVLLILKDMIFSTVHITKERDPIKLREQFSVGSAEELSQTLQLENQT